MRTLNLVNPDNSHVRYTIQNMPDGQHNVVIDPRGSHMEYGLAEKHDYPILIKSRLNNWIDLEIIICAVASLRELGVDEIHLYTPYILGARSDRKFEEGGNNYLRDVICPVINSIGFKTVTCIDPHSDVLEACIKGFRKESNLALVSYSLNTIYATQLRALGSTYRNSVDYIHDRFILVSPDAGASKKIYKLAEQIGYKGDVITCSKDRDTEGKLTKLVIPLTYNHIANEVALAGKSKDIIIIDDICDGGATFINIAKEIKNNKETSGYGKNDPKIYLIVTHGVFSKGTTELGQYFDAIYCTNSYKNCNQLELMKVKQLNVF